MIIDLIIYKATKQINNIQETLDRQMIQNKLEGYLDYNTFVINNRKYKRFLSPVESLIEDKLLKVNNNNLLIINEDGSNNKSYSLKTPTERDKALLMIAVDWENKNATAVQTVQNDE